MLGKKFRRITKNRYIDKKIKKIPKIYEKKVGGRIRLQLFEAIASNSYEELLQLGLNLKKRENTL